MARVRKENQSAVISYKDTVWRIGLYIRLSREDGNDESESVVNQKKILNSFLDKDFDEPYELVDYFIDDGLSGTDDSRADFMRLIGKVESNDVNCIVVKTLSRAFRNYADQGFYLENYFPQKSVRFISLGDPRVDTFKNPEAIHGLELPIAGVLNDRYAAITSNAVRRTFKIKREGGEFIGAFPPYGFLKDPENKNRLILDPDTHPIKLDMKDWIITEGLSLGGVVKRLNSLGIPNPAAYKKTKGWKYRNPHSLKNDGLWNPKTVKGILLSPANIGSMVQGKQKIVSYKVHDRKSIPEQEWFVKENVIEPSFTQEDYDKLVALMTRDTREMSGNGTVHILAGFLRCADCDKAMHRKKAGDKHVYLYCRSYKDKKICSPHTITEEELHQAVLSSIRAHVDLIQSLADIVARINQSPAINTHSDRVAKMLSDKKLELEKTKLLQDGLYVDWRSGIIDKESYQRMRMNFDAKIEQLKISLHNLEEEQRKLQHCTNSENEVFRRFLKFRNLTELDRSVIIEMIENVYIHEDKALMIEFQLDDEVESIKEFIQMNTLKLG